MAKIRISNENFQRFSGIQVIREEVTYKNVIALCDKMLGQRCKSTAGYAYSQIIDALISTLFAGGSCIEDVNRLREELHTPTDNKRIPSSDTVLRMLRELSVADEVVACAHSQKEYNFNCNHTLNSLLLSVVLELGLLQDGSTIDFDYDNQLIRAEKHDCVPTYKETKGYFPGIAFANGIPFYIEMRSGNAPVTFEQASTLENAFKQLEAKGLKVRNARMDAGSYTEAVINMVEAHTDHFYIRSNRTRRKNELAVNNGTHWKPITLERADGTTEVIEVLSIINDDICTGKEYRDVIYRYRDKSYDNTLYENDECVRYRYFSIVTNDEESSEEEIIHYYNHRGSIERVFDQLNNDFNWNKLPSSDMCCNNVYMVLSAIALAVFNWYSEHIQTSCGIKTPKRYRLKRMMFECFACVGKWIKLKGEWILQLYRPPELLTRYVAVLQKK